MRPPLALLSHLVMPAFAVFVLSACVVAQPAHALPFIGGGRGKVTVTIHTGRPAIRVRNACANALIAGSTRVSNFRFPQTITWSLRAPSRRLPRPRFRTWPTCSGPASAIASYAYR